MAHQHCAQGEGSAQPVEGSAGGLEARLGLDGLDVVGAVRGRLVLGLLVLHGGVGALGAIVGVRRGERRRLTARGARAREDKERLGDELCEGSEIPGVSVTVDRQSLEARGFSIRRSRRWLRDVD